MFKHRDVRVTILIKAPASRIYRALTSARELCTWWSDRAETEARNGGRLRLWFAPTADLPCAELRGVFVDLDPGHKIAWLLQPVRRGHRREPALATFFIEPNGRSRRVTLLHAGFSSAKSWDSLVALRRASWEDCLLKLGDYLERGRVHKGARLSLAKPRALAAAR